MNKFENLKVWNNSLFLVNLVYKLCLNLPKTEQRNLIDQIKRSSVSVCLNIAEGTGSENDKEYVRYLNIAKKSITEVIAILKVVQSLYNLDIAIVENKAIEISKMLSGLINFLRKDKKENSL